MTTELERTLFLLAHCRLLLLELQDVERQLRQLASTASHPEKPLLEEARSALVESVVTGRSALDAIEELVPTIEAEIEGRPEAR